MDYSGKIIKKTPVVPSQTSASGVWTLDDALQATKSNTWPVANVPDPISRSLRFRRSASAFLNRTPATTTNRQTWTWSGWVKRGQLGVTQTLFSAGDATSAIFYNRIVFDANNNLSFYNYPDTTATSSGFGWLTSTAVYRDPSAWYHVVCIWDSANATSSNRMRMFVNGVQVTSFISDGFSPTYPNQNTNSVINNSSYVHRIGQTESGNTGLLDGYMAEVNFIDGQALTPSSFGGTNAVTGVWEPRPYTGTYGTNGFLLTFSDITSTTTLGNDTSGNSNNWTTNNISLTAGSTYDSMLDVPTQWIGYNTGDVASVTRGNYCTWNPLRPAAAMSYSNANLSATSNGGSGRSSFGTFGMSSGKWYFELTGSDNSSGIATVDESVYAYYQSSGSYLIDGTTTSGKATYTTTDIIGCAYNADTNTIEWFKNNVSQGTISFSSASGKPVVPVFNGTGSVTRTCVMNCGAGSGFAYTPPAGFLSLCTTNLPSPTILQGDDYFNAVLWTGNNTQPRAITGVGFQPSFAWMKNRNQAYFHQTYDAVRGTGSATLYTNSTSAEDPPYYLDSFDSDGVTLGSNLININNSGDAIVGWFWNAGTSTVTNTSGSISAQVRASTTAGFSIATYTGTGSVATVGHGLGAAPAMIIIKNRDGTPRDWAVYHAGNTSSPATQRLLLSSTAATDTNSGYWNDTLPSSSVFTIGTNTNVNPSSTSMVAYCFAAVPGYSAFGTYTGNGGTDGPFVYCGFRPRYIMVKRTDVSGHSWGIVDSARDTYNVTNKIMQTNVSDAEYTLDTPADFLSNGFKIRVNNNSWNNSSGTYIFMAFAENPFKNALAR